MKRNHPPLSSLLTRAHAQACAPALIRTLFAAMLLPWACSAAEIKWMNADGGDFSDPANWDLATVPGKDDSASFNLAADFTVAFDGNVTNKGVKCKAPGGTVTWAIGPGNLYRSLSALRIESTSGSPCLRLASGTASIHGHVMLGDVGLPASLEVAGSNSVLMTTYYDVTAGYNQANANTIHVVDGGFIDSFRHIYAGYNASSSNRITVAGPGSRIMTRNKGFLCSGTSGDDNLVIIENQAAAWIAYGIMIGDGTAATGNAMILRSGAAVTNDSQSVYVGNAGPDNAMTVDDAFLFAEGNCLVGNKSTNNRLAVENAGVVNVKGHVIVGHASAAATNNLVIVNGPGSLVKTLKYDINVGNLGLGNRFVVTNGATASTFRSIHVGYYTGSAGTGSFNELLVTGEGSSLVCESSAAANALLIGYAGSNNVVRIENGARFQATASKELEVKLGALAGSDRNRLLILSGSTATNSFDVSVGVNGSSNELVVDNAEFTSKSNITCGHSSTSRGNAISVANGGLLRARKLYVGNRAGATGNMVRVVGAGSLLDVYDYDLFVGNEGADNALNIEDGGEVHVNRVLYLGKDASGSNSLLRVAGGSLVCTNADSSIDIRYNGTLAVEGTGGSIKVKAASVRDGSALQFRLDDNGVTPVEVSGTLTLDETTRIVVDARGIRAEGETIPLVRYGEIVGAVPEENITLLPVGTTIDFADGKSISVRLPRGTVIVVR